MYTGARMETDSFLTDIIPAIERWRAEGHDVAIATVVRVEGTAPRREGAKLAVSSEGEIAGSVSGGCVEGAVIGEAYEVLSTGTPRMLSYGITPDMLTDIGLSCGGTIKVFVEKLDW
jgi:xanthine/CO dehydrogenase XdhC/CoxF family maturation factor